ncbi:MAG: BrnT family toxin [Xanthobacteraceae bacterium]
MFAGRVIERSDDRYDYGEIRVVTIGFLRDRMVVVVWTPRGAHRHIISMRKADEREKARYGREFERGRK